MAIINKDGFEIDENGVLIKINEEAIKRGKLIIPAGVTEIAANAVMWMADSVGDRGVVRGITHLEIPESVKKIAKGELSKLIDLKSRSFSRKTSTRYS